MKKIKTLLIFLLFILFIIFLISCFISPSSSSNTTITISGHIKDNNGNFQEGVKATIIPVNGTNQYTATTDANGFYSVEVPSGNYVIQYDYKAQSILLKNSSSYDGNLEIAIIYENGFDISPLKNEINGLVNSGNTLRIIESPYSNNTELRTMINLLKQDSQEEHAFHKIGKQNWKSIAVILSDQQANVVQSINEIDFGSDYRFIPLSNSVSLSTIIEEINKELSLSSSNGEEILDENYNSTTISQTKQVSLEKNSVIDVILEALTTGNLPVDDKYPDYISGELLYEDGSKITDKIEITLENLDDPSLGQKITRSVNGHYQFARPIVQGNYQITFQFATRDVNGQYYEVVSDYVLVDNATSPEQNTINPSSTNIETIKDKFTNITYTEENILDNNPEETALIGKTEPFTVTYETEDTNNKVDDPDEQEEIEKKYAGARLKEREKFSLSVQNIITKYQLFLNDGQLLYDWDRNANKEDSGIDLGLFVLTLDDEIRHGAVLYAEYKITVSNSSDIDCDSYTILNHCNFMYDANQTLLSQDKPNNDYGWQAINATDVEQLIGKSNSKKFPTYLKLEDKSGLPARKQKEFYLTVSMTLSDPPQFVDVAEIVQYGNKEGRRNYESDPNTYEISNNIVRAGNYINGAQETDTGISEIITVLPPFGSENNAKTNLFLISGCFIVALFVILVYVKGNHKPTKKHGKRYFS